MAWCNWHRKPDGYWTIYSSVIRRWSGKRKLYFAFNLEIWLLIGWALKLANQSMNTCFVFKVIAHVAANTTEFLSTRQLLLLKNVRVILRFDIQQKYSLYILRFHITFKRHRFSVLHLLNDHVNKIPAVGCVQFARYVCYAVCPMTFKTTAILCLVNRECVYIYT